MTPAALRALMVAKGLTAGAVAAQAGCKERAVYYWLAGQRTMSPTASELLLLKTALLPDVGDRAADST